MRNPGHKPVNKVLGYLIAASALALCLPRSWTDRLDGVLALVTSPLSGPSRAVSLAVAEPLRRPAAASVPGPEYQRLRQALQVSEAQRVNQAQELARLTELNVRLAGLRQMSGMAQARFVQAQAVGSDSSSHRRILRLNQGAAQQLRPGQIVLSPVAADSAPGPPDPSRMCVVGRIRSTATTTSRLQLLNDPDFRLKVFVEPAANRREQWQQPGMLSGSEAGLVLIGQVSRDHKIRPGDIVLARSDPRDLPVPLLLGTVLRCDENDEAPVLGRITVQPAADLQSLRDLAVVVMNN